MVRLLARRLAQTLPMPAPRFPVQDGFPFFLALNGVLLCEGPLPVGYLRRIERGSLPPDWQPQ